MGNEFNVIEEGVIQCVCGGTVVLKSTVWNRVINGKKPLYLEDLQGAPIKGCPKKRPCTVVANKSYAGTEINVHANKGANTYLLRTDGFVSNKGRKIVLITPGQFTSHMSAIPSLENQVVIPEEWSEVEQKKAKELIEKEKFQLYFLRKSQDIFKPLRPTRAFREALEVHSTDSNDEFEDNSIHAHTFAFLYVRQNNKTIEYQVFSEGTVYGELHKEIFFQNTQSNAITQYIPIYEDGKIDIAYSHIRLGYAYDDLDDANIKKLKKLTLDPTAPDGKKTFYIKDQDDINMRELTQEDLDNKKHTTIANKTKKITCIIEDIIGEIEDMYLQYHDSYKTAMRTNHDIIEDIKKQNQYPYTICNLLDHFYISSDEKKTYDEEVYKLKNLYEQMLGFLLNEPELVDAFIAKDKDLSKNLEEDKDKIGQSYIQQLRQIKGDFFDDDMDDTDQKKKDRALALKSAYISNSKFKTGYGKYGFWTTLPSGRNRSQISGWNLLEFNSTNDDFTGVKDNPKLLLGHLVFTLFFSEEEIFEKQLSSMNCFSKIESLRDKFLIQLRSTPSLPNISEQSIKDVTEGIKKSDQTYFKAIAMHKSYKDPYLYEYENLDHEKKIQSFNQDGNSFSFKTKLMYYDKSLKYYKNDNVLPKPKAFIKQIETKLKDPELIKVLKIYKSLTQTNSFNYVVSAMNILYMLCTPRTYLDEESDKTTLFAPELNHLYDFLIDTTDKRIKLDDSLKDLLNTKYEIANSYGNMLIKLMYKDILFAKTKSPKAMLFIQKYKTTTKDKVQLANEEKSDKYDNSGAIHQDIKSTQRQIFETMQTIEGVSGKLNDIIEKYLEEIKAETSQDRPISNTTLNRVHNRLKVFSALVAFGNAVDYLFFQESDQKNIKSHMGFVKDMLTVEVTLVAAMQTKNNSSVGILKQLLDDKNMKKNVSKHNLKMLTVFSESLLKKVSIATVLVTTLYDSVRLYRREDYDAMAASVLLGGVSLALAIATPALPFVVLGVIVSIILAIVVYYVTDTDLDIYLKKSLLYKTIDFSIWRAITDKQQAKKYQAPYLYETTNKNAKLKAISHDGYNTPKPLIDFIGKNYKTNEIFFDTALRNELSFLNSAIYGYKIEHIDSRRKVKTLYNKFGTKEQLWESTYVKIPKNLYEDKETKFIFEMDGQYKLFGKADEHLFKLENDYYIFDLFYQDYTYLEELEMLNHKEASLIVISDSVELKYTFIYDYKEIVYLDTLNYTQASFTPQDSEKLEQLLKDNDEMPTDNF